VAIVVPGKFVYLATPYTASMATVRELRRIENAIMMKPHHSTWPETRAKWDPKLTGDELVFTVVRNPHDWIVTAFLRWKGSLEVTGLAEFIRTFDRDPFIRDGKIFWQVLDGVVQWRRHETLQQDLDTILEDAGLPKVKLVRKNVTNGKRYWAEYFNDEARAAMRERFGDEIVKYGYEWPL
jgi:hypothetical protein